MAADSGVFKSGNILQGQYVLGLRLTIALSVGIAIALGVVRIVMGWPLPFFIIGGYLFIVVATIFAPEEIIGIAYDSGGITTSTITVPLVTALGLGLASSIRGRHPILDGFGLIALASLTPILFVMMFGILVLWCGRMMDTELVTRMIDTLTGTLVDILPIVLTLGFFQLLVIRKPFHHVARLAFGMIFVIFGFSLFILGLEQCIFPIGADMAEELTRLSFLTGGDEQMLAQIQSSGIIDPSLYVWTYSFAFLIGFSTTLAEPALIAVAIKAREISTGAISEWGLRISVALGVAVGVSLGCYRIVSGNPLYIYIIAGYIFLLIQIRFAPKEIIPLAFDSGGVTTSTVTVPLLAALGIGLASNVPGRSVLLDGFGLIAFASLFPMITVNGYAMITEFKARRAAKENNLEC